MTNWKNRTLFHGDNLKYLRTMNSESVDLIATDPPFNKGRDFHATPDSLASGARFQDRWVWERDVHQEWVDQITDDYPRLLDTIEIARHAHSDGMGAFMCFMAVRLLEMHRVLKSTGSLYLHCDPTASHYLKAVMDAIFGWHNFRNEIVWCYNRFSRRGDAYASMHDIILFYAKGKQPRFNKPTTMAKNRNRYEKGYHVVTDRGETRLLVYDEALARAKIAEAKKIGRTIRYTKAQIPTLGSVWSDIAIINPQAKERTGYPTQKPLALYERIIKASSNEGDIVLDPFCGCATTLIAAERLKRQWVGMDIWDNAKDLVLNRLESEGMVKKDNDKNGLFDEEVHFIDTPPKRTDDGETASPFLRVKEGIKEPEGIKMTRQEMYEFLLTQHGPVCQGCDRRFDDPRYLELDHNTPRSDGGLNHITNRILLCGPCNNLKSNIYTLSGLRRQNRKLGYMSKEGTA